MEYEEHAEQDEVVVLDLGYKPEAAVSGEHLVASDITAWVTFNAVKLEPDGYYHQAGIGILEFSECSLSKFGYPNDEGLQEHPLYDKMRGGYAIYEVLNSSWISELGWERSGTERHFIVTFHETTFECIARDVRLEVTWDPFEAVLHRIGERLL